MHNALQQRNSLWRSPCTTRWHRAAPNMSVCPSRLAHRYCNRCGWNVERRKLTLAGKSYEKERAILRRISCSGVLNDPSLFKKITLNKINIPLAQFVMYDSSGAQVESNIVTSDDGSQDIFFVVIIIGPIFFIS